MLVTAGTGAHAVAAVAVQAVALQVTGIATVASTHLGTLRRGEASARAVVRSGAGARAAKGRRRSGAGLAVGEWLQLIGRSVAAGLSLATERRGGLGLESGRAAGKAVVHAAKAAAAPEARLATTLSGAASAVISKSGAETRIALGRGLVEGAGGRGVVVRRVRRDSVRLAVHAALAAVWTEAPLAVARVVLVVVRVAVVGVIVTRVLLTVRLRLRSRSSLLLLRLLGLAGRVRCVVAAVLGIGSTSSDAWLTLRVLAEVVALLGGVVATKAALLGGSTVGLALTALLLTELLAVVVVVRVPIVLTRGVVRRIFAGRRAEGSAGLLRLWLRGRCRKVIERRLRGGCLLRERILRLGSRCGILRSSLAVTAELRIRSRRS